MTWPVPYIEQAVYYQRLLDELSTYQANNKPITVHSFSEPTQEQWEAAYIAQGLHQPPIRPGARLYWFDLKNGTTKAYTTVWKNNNVDIDPLVRPLSHEDQARGCLRYLGRRTTYGGSVFSASKSPIRYNAYGIFFDLELLVKKNLLAVIVQYKDQSPVMISFFGEVAAADIASQWGRTDQAFGYTLERAAAAATSTYRVVGGGSQPVSDIYYTLASWNSGAITPVVTETNYGYALIFAPSAPFVNGEHQAGNNEMNYIGLAAALTAQATPLRLWQSFGSKYDGSGLRELRIGTPTSRGATSANYTAHLYGLFASDPGVLEVFDV
jgi:hypothetical protein